MRAEQARSLRSAMKPILFAILAGLCWGVGEIFTKKALNTGAVGPMTAMFVRAVVTVVLSGWRMRRRRT